MILHYSSFEAEANQLYNIHLLILECG